VLRSSWVLTWALGVGWRGAYPGHGDDPKHTVFWILYVFWVSLNYLIPSAVPGEGAASFHICFLWLSLLTPLWLEMNSGYFCITVNQWLAQQLKKF
jgi:hypothetical protein